MKSYISNIILFLFLMIGLGINGQTVDLTTHVTSTPPIGTVIQWHSSSTPSSGTLLPSTVVTASSTPTNYWVYYYDSNGDCYSPGSKVTVLSNSCPEANADLTSVPVTPTAPAGTTLEWYTSSTPSSGSHVDDPTSVGNGTYWPAYYDAGADCYSQSGSPVIVSIQSCNAACYKPGATTGGATLDTPSGITSLGRAGKDDSDQWPMVRKGAWTVLESKTKGFVVNRVSFTGANPDGIPAANFVEGMMVYDTTNNCLKLYTSTDGGTTFGWYCLSTQACP